MSNVSDFYSVNNMKKLIIVFESFLKDKYNTNVTDLKLNLKETILNIMERLRKNPLHKDMNLGELNKITLQTLKDIVKNNHLVTLDKENKFLNKQNISNRDHELYSNRQNNYNNISNINENSTVNNNNDEVLEQYNKLNELRQIDIPKSTLKELKSEENDQHIDQEDFEKRLKFLQSNREEFFEIAKNANQGKQVLFKDELDNIETFTNKKEKESNIELKIDDTSYANKLLSSTSEQMFDRNNLDMSKYQDLGALDPKRMFEVSEPIESIEKNQTINKPYTDINVSMPIIKRDKSAVKETFIEKYLCINSGDRDWISQRNRYKYLVKFNYAHKTTRKIPVFENNPTIPGSKNEFNTNGLANTFGYYDSNNVYHNAYNPAVNLGNEIDYEFIEYSEDENINVQNNFRDIYSIEVSKIIIPSDIVNVTYGRTYNFNMNYPYLLLQIDEFRDIYEGTDEAIRKSFCQLVYETTYQSSNGRGYIVLKPVQNEKKIFKPTLLSSLPSLTFSIVNPSGEILNKSKDGYSIGKLEYEPFNPYYLKIVTNQYFDKNEFFSGDHVVFKQYHLYKTHIDQDADNINKLNNFINRVSGHDIVKLGDANDNSYYRTFYIRAPGYFDENAGTYIIDNDEDSSIIREVMFYYCNIYNADDTRNDPNNGYILNMSLQNTISMKIVMKIQESTILIPESVHNI